ncbi:MAG: putative Phospholipase/Transphosphatidylase [Betaproteobacteria bacterium]|nr:putative Phospholipase/Transphosphatidylase [Betaproteobacteria bacterium]
MYIGGASLYQEQENEHRVASGRLRNSAASLFQPGRNCSAVARASRASLLIDGDAYFKAFTRAAERARHSIIILAWDFDSRTRLHGDDDGKFTELGAFLTHLVKRRRSLNVYVLDWDYPMVFGTDREFPPIYGLGWKPHRRIHIRYDNTHPTGGSHHQKIVVIDDGVAFSGGLDLTSRRWDTCDHLGSNPKRLANDAQYPPFHDTMAAVDGEAARALAGIARERWALATGKPIPAVNENYDAWPDALTPDLTNVVVAVSRTVPEGEGRKEIREIEALYLDMIARAQRHIYIENQYFTADRLGNALEKRLAENDGPEIVVVLRRLSHGWLEEYTMHVLRTRLIQRLKAVDRHGRFHVYYPHTPGLQDGTCIDVHSKLMIADDEWLRIGSANFCNRSMGLDTECDLTFEARGDMRVAAVVREFRERLLAEHLGVEPQRMRAEIARAGSLHAAIAALQSAERTLKNFDDMVQWPEALVSVLAVADPERPVSLDKLVREFGATSGSQRSGVAWRKVLVFLCVLAALAAIWRFTPLAEFATADRITQWARDFSTSPWAPVVVLAAYTPASLIMFPRPLITLFAVLVFGPWQGFAYALTGILLAALATYFAGRLLDRATVRRLAGPKLNRVSEKLSARGLLAMTAVRLVPVAPFFVVNMIAGAIRIKLWHFLAGTAIGMLPGTLAATVFADQLETALRRPGDVNLWLIGGIVLFMAAAIVFVRKAVFTDQPQTTKALAAARL